MNLKQLIRETLENKDCCTATKPTKAPILNESVAPREILSEGLKYHIDNKKPLTEHVYRAGSSNYFNLWAEARTLYTRGILDFSGDDLAILTETHLGEFGIYEDKKVPLDFIMEDMELEEEKKDPPIGKPKRGGAKKFYVYVKDKGKIKKVSFGDTSGLSAKINNSKARAAFSKRHDCPNKKDRTKASYWSCRLPRYARLLGLKSNFSGFW
jgi:hypothetical protein